MFTVDLEESKTSKGTIGNVSKNVFKKFLRFLYAGQADDLGSDVIELLELAEKYEVADLKVACETTMMKNLTTENAVGIFKYAHHYRCTDELKQACFVLFKDSFAVTQSSLPNEFVANPEAVMRAFSRKRSYEEALQGPKN